ncbi:MAG: tRNA lysidine(34) synthetase TilS [Cyclobacteriaceae bacterium]
MLHAFTHALSRLCSPDQRILLAVSGGIDSMVMLHLFHQVGYKIGVAHCNFQLRGAASDEDERLVKQTCEQLNIPFHAIRFETNNYAAVNRFSTQMAARELRYAWFREVMQAHTYHKLATAHHLNDNLETTLLNFVRGTGISGIKGIPPTTDNIIRPLLAFTKKELVDYASDHQLTWREDASNATDDYDRNQLRHQVIPKLQELNPALEDTFKRTNQRLQGAAAVFQLGLSHLRQLFVREEKNRITISTDLLQHIAFPEVVLWELLKDYGFNHTQCADAVAAADQSGKIFHSASHQLTIDRNTWIVSPLATELSPTAIQATDKKVTLGAWQLTLETTTNSSFSTDPATAQLDASKITFPLTWRKWKEGDTFAPLGMDNQKKLSNFFIDAKVPRADKDVATVLESNGNIIWVVGYRIDNRYKITAQTKDVLQLTLQPQL